MSTSNTQTSGVPYTELKDSKQETLEQEVPVSKKRG